MITWPANRGAEVASILDVAPSVLVLAGAAPPAYMDGEPLLGMLSPVIAALAMALSSVSVIGNALRLRSVRL